MKSVSEGQFLALPLGFMLSDLWYVSWTPWVQPYSLLTTVIVYLRGVVRV